MPFGVGYFQVVWPRSDSDDSPRWHSIRPKIRGSMTDHTDIIQLSWEVQYLGQPSTATLDSLRDLISSAGIESTQNLSNDELDDILYVWGTQQEHPLDIRLVYTVENTDPQMMPPRPSPAKQCCCGFITIMLWHPQELASIIGPGSRDVSPSPKTSPKTSLQTSPSPRDSDTNTSCIDRPDVATIPSTSTEIMGYAATVTISKPNEPPPTRWRKKKAARANNGDSNGNADDNVNDPSTSHTGSSSSAYISTSSASGNWQRGGNT